MEKPKNYIKYLPNLSRRITMTQVNHIKDTLIKGRTVTFIVDDVGQTVSDLAAEYGITGKNIEAKVAHQLGLKIKEETGAGRIKVLFATAMAKVHVALPKFVAGENGQLTTTTGE
jgi:hypothetical protein